MVGLINLKTNNNKDETRNIPSINLIVTYYYLQIKIRKIINLTTPIFKITPPGFISKSIYI